MNDTTNRELYVTTVTVTYIRIREPMIYDVNEKKIDRLLFGNNLILRCCMTVSVFDGGAFTFLHIKDKKKIFKKNT